jgi:hypothetical protein
MAFLSTVYTTEDLTATHASENPESFVYAFKSSSSN